MFHLKRTNVLVGVMKMKRSFKFSPYRSSRGNPWHTEKCGQCGTGDVLSGRCLGTGHVNDGGANGSKGNLRTDAHVSEVIKASRRALAARGTCVRAAAHLNAA